MMFGLPPFPSQQSVCRGSVCASSCVHRAGLITFSTPCLPSTVHCHGAVTTAVVVKITTAVVAALRPMHCRAACRMWMRQLDQTSANNSGHSNIHSMQPSSKCTKRHVCAHLQHSCRPLYRPQVKAPGAPSKLTERNAPTKQVHIHAFLYISMCSTTLIIIHNVPTSNA
jgi:hypothetical protein